MPTLSERVSRDLLPFVQQPAQYIGKEVNQLVRDGDAQRADLHVAIAFPDAYQIGTSHSGSQILYWMANHTPGVCCERVYCPLPDAEHIMREKDIELFTWDTRQPVRRVDVLAFSLQYELTYTNVLTMLDLAGIALHSAARREDDPIVLAGGPMADSPEPMAAFLDLIFIGDAEPVLTDLLDAFKQCKQAELSRHDTIVRLAEQFDCLYAPSLYDVTYNADGTIAAITPNTPQARPQVQRCRTDDFEHAPAPLRPIVPHIETVHERVALEIMRGCPNRCRFCHAGCTKFPVRIRSVQTLMALAEQTWRATGYDEIGLLSLSTGDYPHLADLTNQINAIFSPRHVSMSVPSLRIDSMLQALPWMINAVRKPSLTFAPEAATDALRNAIRKDITNADLLDTLGAAYQAGWRRVKLYFMCGLPGETEADIAEIYHLSAQASRLRKDLLGSPATVTASVGWLVPKPHTPMQWAGQSSVAYFQNARRLLTDLARNGRLPVKFRWHNAQRSQLEAVLSLGDRRLAPMIESAWRLGARFDGWDEWFQADLWRQAASQTQIDWHWYANRPKGCDEVLSWQHLAAGRPLDTLISEYEDLLATARTPTTQPD